MHHSALINDENMTISNKKKLYVLKSTSDDSPPLLIAEIPRWKSSKLMTPRPLGSKNFVRSFT